MATIVTKSTGATAVNRPLTTTELDNNFINLNAAITTYTLPVATASVLGGVKQGTNTTIAADGTISVATGAGYSYTLPVATASVLGGVKQGTNITITADGTISAASGGITTGKAIAMAIVFG